MKTTPKGLLTPKKNKNEFTKMSIHAVNNLTPGHIQRELFNPSAVPAFSTQHGHETDCKIDSYGMSPNVMDLTISDAILKAFTDTGYQGNLPMIKARDLAKNKYKTMPKAYRLVGEFPSIRISENELLRLAGIHPNSGISKKKRARDSILKLGNKQYFFRYQRLAKDLTGKPIFDKDKKSGKLVQRKEIVELVDTPFTIKAVKRDNSKKALRYYEITLSVIYADQVESYYMLVPYKWHEEIRQAVDKARISPHILYFFLFLIKTHEQYRSKKATQPYILRYKWETVAQYAKMPESVWRGQKKRANEILNECYRTAKKLKYLTFFERNGLIDTLCLNSERFPTHTIDSGAAAGNSQ